MERKGECICYLFRGDPLRRWREGGDGRNKALFVYYTAFVRSVPIFSLCERGEGARERSLEKTTMHCSTKKRR